MEKQAEKTERGWCPAVFSVCSAMIAEKHDWKRNFLMVREYFHVDKPEGGCTMKEMNYGH